MKNPTPANPVMTDNLLFEHFATLATAPEGIARLRELFLQLAVQGKLGTQDEGDEPASVLVNKIRRDRAKIDKKWKKFDPILDSELPYKIPDGWVWNRLGDVVILRSGSSFDQSSDLFDNGIPYVKVGDMNHPGNKKIITTSSQFVKISEENLREIIPKNTIIFPKRGGAIATNKKRIVDTEIFVDSNTMAMICPDSINLDYLYYWFSQVDLWSLNSGTSVPQINNKDIDPLLFPLPPLAEQHRIVAKVNQLMALCDELETRQQHERAGCLKLGTASLSGLQNAESPEEFGQQWAQVCDAFDLILDCPENVAVLRQTILQMAVQGRLVRQESGDEPAAKLVGLIRKEKERLMKEGKIKHEKPLGKIKEIKIPAAWQLCHLGEISEIIMGNSPPGETYNSYGDGVPLINGPTEFSKPPLGKTIISQYTTQPTKFCKENDLLICVRGATTGRTNIAGFYACVGRGVAVIRSPSIQSYLNLFMLTKAQQILDMGTGSTFPSISQNDLLTIPVPLPPLAEQHRIVAKVDALMALCDALESRLKERAGVQTKFTDAVVKSVGTG